MVLGGARCPRSASNGAVTSELRPPRDEDEVAAWYRAEALGFSMAPSDEFVAAERTVLPAERTLGVWEDGRPVAVSGWYPFHLTLPGGAAVPVAGVCDVSVLPHARRRGHLSAMLRRLHDEARERGEPAAVLTASAGSIYGRFGYGPATLEARWELDVRTARLAEPPERRLPVEVVAGVDAAERLAALDARRERPAGSLTRSVAWWRLVTGPFEHWKGGGHVLTLFLGDADGDAGAAAGAAVYRLHPSVDHGVQQWRLELLDLVATDPRTEAEVWAALWELDHVTTVAPRIRPLDDPLRWRLEDPRQLRVRSVVDFLWVCPLDPAALLAARSYSAEVSLVLALDDAFDPEVAGTYRVDGGPGGAVCEPAPGAAPDLRLSAATLGMLVLGGHRTSLLADAGRVEECRPGAVAVADAALAGGPAPYCATYF